MTKKRPDNEEPNPEAISEDHYVSRETLGDYVTREEIGERYVTKEELAEFRERMNAELKEALATYKERLNAVLAWAEADGVASKIMLRDGAGSATYEAACKRRDALRVRL